MRTPATFHLVICLPDPLRRWAPATASQCNTWLWPKVCHLPMLRLEVPSHVDLPDFTVTHSAGFEPLLMDRLHMPTLVPFVGKRCITLTAGIPSHSTTKQHLCDSSAWILYWKHW